MNNIEIILLASVRINGGTQSRVAMNEATISEYAETIRSGTDLPPVIVFFDGAIYWLADGFHRYRAHMVASASEISAHVHTGSQREAILFSCGANAAHGLRRTNDDKRHAVQTMLNDGEWAAWSDREIARQCAVSNMLVGEMRKPKVKELSVSPSPPTPAAEQKTANTEKDNPDVVESDSTKPAYFTPFPDPFNDDHDQATPVEQVAVSVSIELAAEVQALREQLAEIAENMESTLADNNMMGRVFDADDRVKAALIEVERYRAIADNAERTLASKSGEFKTRADQCAMWMGRAQRAEKKLEKYEAKK